MDYILWAFKTESVDVIRSIRRGRIIALVALLSWLTIVLTPLFLTYVILCCRPQ